MAGYKRKNDIDFLVDMGYKYGELERLSDKIIQNRVEKIKSVKIEAQPDSRFDDSFVLLREVVGTSLADMSAATDILSINLSRYERGMFEPTLSIAQKIAAYFETTIGDMMSFNYNLGKLIDIKEAFCKTHGNPVNFFPHSKEKAFNKKLVIEAIEKENSKLDNDLDRLVVQYLTFKIFLAWRDNYESTDRLSTEFQLKFRRKQ